MKKTALILLLVLATSISFGQLLPSSGGAKLDTTTGAGVLTKTQAAATYLTSVTAASTYLTSVQGSGLYMSINQGLGFDTATVEVYDDFLVGQNVSDNYFTLIWRGNNGNPAFQYERGTWGVMKLTATSGNMQVNQSPTTYGLYSVPTNFNYLTRLKLLTSNDGHKVYFGFSYPFSTSEPNSGIYFKMDSTTAKLVCVSRNGGSATEVYTAQAVDNAYHKYEIIKTGASIMYKFDGLLLATITTNIPAATVDNLDPIYDVIDAAGAAVTMYVDYFRMKITGLSR